MRILVAEPLSEEGLALLRARHEVDVRPGLTRLQLLAALPGYDALVVRDGVRVDADAVAAAPRLLAIGTAGASVDNLDIDAATRAGIVVVTAPSANVTAVAEHTLALLLALARRIVAADAAMRSETVSALAPGIELQGRTLGLIGFGRVGSAVAVRARALEMEVIAHDPFVAPESAAARGVTLVPLDELLARADAVSLHAPATQLTRGMLGAAQISRMKPGALVVNTARAALVDDAALAVALREGHVAGAAFDVAPDELRGSPLLGSPNVLLTPAIAASTREAEVRMAVEVSEQVIDVLAGHQARYAVNAALLPPETARVLAPFVPLARAIGEFYAQFVGQPFGELRLEIAGELAAHDTNLLGTAVLCGLIGASTTERVNHVNASDLARENGIELAQSTTPDAGTYASLITLEGAGTVAGTIVNGEPRLVRLGDFWIDMAPAEHMIVTRHRDQPRTMGRIGLLIGDADVNISDMHLARRRARDDALMVIALDGPIPERVAEAIRANEAVSDVWLIHLAGWTPPGEPAPGAR